LLGVVIIPFVLALLLKCWGDKIKTENYFKGYKDGYKKGFRQGLDREE
jgi:hypothetical protein